jgi:hypothetical protein
MWPLIKKEFFELYGIVEDTLVEHWKTRGRKPTVSIHDVLFLALLWLKNYSRFLELARSFDLKESIVKNTDMWTLKATGSSLCEKLIKPIREIEQVSCGKNLLFIM